MSRMDEFTMIVEGMFFIDNMTPTEIAKKLNVPAGMIQEYLAQFDKDDGQPTESED